MAGLATAGAGAAALGLFSRAKGRLLVQGPGAFAPACALGMQSFVGSARLWAGAAGGSAAFHTTAPCEARLRMRGTVVSDKAQKSVVVAVERIFKHPVVKKFVKERSKFMAHDELDQFKVPIVIVPIFYNAVSSLFSRTAAGPWWLRLQRCANC